MTDNDLTKEIVRLRKEKGLTQNQVADKIGMRRSTYAKKEVEADFTDEEISLLAKLFRSTKLLDIYDKIIKIDDWKEFLIKSTINLNATQRVVLMVLAELLAKQKNENVSKTLNDLTKIVEAERLLHPMK